MGEESEPASAGDMKLRQLVAHALSVAAHATVEEVHAAFKRCDVEYMAVLEGTVLLGVCTRRHIAQALSARFGFALNARQPVRLHLSPEPLSATVATPIMEVFRLIAHRGDREFYDDVLLVESNGTYVGLIPMRTLVRLQTDFLQGSIANLESSRSEIATRNRQMEDDLQVAREIQLAMSPPSHLRFGAGNNSLDVEHRLLAASGMSGDFLDVIALEDDCVGLLVCDVMGHGVRSALITAMVRATVEELKPIASDPGRFLTRLNQDLSAILQPTGSLVFVTAGYVVINARSGAVRYGQAGHPTPLLWSICSGTTRTLYCPEEVAGPALGLIGDFVFSASQDALSPGDRLVLFTDGVTEAAAASGEEFGEKRLAECLARKSRSELAGILENVLAELRRFCGEQPFADDICLLVAGWGPQLRLDRG